MRPILLLAVACAPEPPTLDEAPTSAADAPTQRRCADDGLEPNDELVAARPLMDALDASLVVTSRSDDFWTFDIYPGNDLVLEAEFAHDDGWGGLELYDAAGNLIDAGVLEPYFAKLVWINTGDFTERVIVRATVYEGTCDAYTMTWTSTPVECPGDLVESNDSPDTAELFASGRGDVVELDDPDWWAVPLPPNTVTGVVVDQPWSFADLELELFDADGVDLNNGGIDGRIANRSDTPGTGLARVSIDNKTQRGVCAPYVLRKRTATAACHPEPVPDDVITDARTLPLGQHEADVVYHDHDWIRVVVPARHRLFVEADVDPLLGKLSLWAYDAAGTYESATATPRPVYGLHAENPTDEDAVWHVQIVATEQLLECVPYTLDLGVIACDREDVLEPNNTLEDALPLPPEGTTLTIRERDPDVWHVASVPPGHTVDVDVGFRESLGRVESTLVLRDGTLVADADGDGDGGHERMRWTNPLVRPVDVYLSTFLPPVFKDCAQHYTVDVLLEE
jgi:hypothetical protein